MKPASFILRLFAETLAIIASVEAVIMFLLPVVAPGVGRVNGTSHRASGPCVR